MELSEPAERIAAAFFPPDSPDYRDLLNAIQPYVDLELDRAWLAAYVHFRSRESQRRADLLLVTDLINEFREKVNQKQARVRLIEASRDKLRPIR